MSETWGQDADLDGVRWVGDLQRVHLVPGDVLVLRCPDVLSEAAVARLKARLEATFAGFPAVILTEGMKLGVVAGGRDDVTAAPQLARSSAVRWAAVLASMELLSAMYTAGWECRSVRCVSGLPAGALFVGAAVEPLPRGLLYLVFEHESFEVSQPWERLPEIQVVFEVERDGQE